MPDGPAEAGYGGVLPSQALRAMADDPVAVDVFDFDGTFEHDGTVEATRVITTAGLQPACDWHLSHDGHTWALDSLRPAG